MCLYLCRFVFKSSIEDAISIYWVTGILEFCVLLSILGDWRFSVRAETVFSLVTNRLSGLRKSY